MAGWSSAATPTCTARTSSSSSTSASTGSTCTTSGATRPSGSRSSAATSCPSCTGERRLAMTGPLDGVRVLELPCIGPGPFATMLLADLGADVVRVDRPGGQVLAAVPPEQDLLGRGKRSIALDLKDPADVARCL